eukprot:scaffold15182_cov165-Alexandrium_tamarense.AAC.2
MLSRVFKHNFHLPYSIYDCLEAAPLHEGSPVLKGCKYVVRTEVEYYVQSSLKLQLPRQMQQYESINIIYYIEYHWMILFLAARYVVIRCCEMASATKCVDTAYRSPQATHHRTMKAYLTIAHGDNTLGTLRLTLRPDIVPKTVENFVHFLTSHEASGSAATTTTSGTTAGKVGGSGYKDSSFHRIIPKFMAQGGDFINHNGTGSTSIYGPNFSDENFLLSHSQRGTLSMANSGPGTNGCQFFITFKATAHLDGRHVVFGSVDWREDDESERVLDQLERVRTDRRNDRPVERVRIVDCGVFNEDGNRGKKNAGGGELSGEKLVGEAKKNKLLQAYGEKMGGDDNPAADDDEIGLDDEEEEEQAEIHVSTHQQNKSANATGDDDEIDLDDENDEQPPAEEEEAPTGKVSSKKAALQKRLAALRTKINQSRTLNRREVHAEATRMGTDEASLKERKRQNKHDKNLKQKEYDTYVVGKLKAVGKGDLKVSADDKAEQKKLASLSEP